MLFLLGFFVVVDAVVVDVVVEVVVVDSGVTAAYCILYIGGGMLYGLA